MPNTKMSKTRLREALNELNKATKKEYVVNALEYGNKKHATYGLMLKNKDGTLDIVLGNSYSQREIYYHIQGFIILSYIQKRGTISTGVK